MSDTRVRASRALQGGIDLHLAELCATNGGVVTGTIEGWQYVALYGIYEELKKLNALLACPNFTGIPHTLKAIERQTKKRKYKRKTQP